MKNEAVGVGEEAGVLSLERSGTMSLYRFAFLSAIVLVSPLVFSQPITGSFVNAALFLSAAYFGFRKESFAIAVVPSVVALATGQLPVTFAPLVPFIMTGNLLLVFLAALGFEKGRNYFVTAASAAVAKSVLLFAVGVTFSGTLYSGTAVAGKMLTMFGWLQLATVLAGAAIAFGVLRILRREER
jgi:hypothetical protein